MGDSVDNVPGIRGIGPKTATKLIQEFGDLESTLAAAEGMKPSKLRERLIEEADMARLSRVLVELKQDCTLPMALDEFELGEIPRDPLIAFLQSHGFSSLLRRLEGGNGSPVKDHQSQSGQAGQSGSARFSPRQPPAAARTARNRSQLPMNASRRSKRSTAGSNGPLPRVWLRSTPKPVPSMP